MNVNVWIDGGCRRNGAADAEGYASVRIVGRKDTLYRVDLANAHTNNQAEYGALLCALDLLAAAKQHAGLHITIYTDSVLMVSQVAEEFKCKNATLRDLRQAVQQGIADFAVAGVTMSLCNVPRDEVLAKLGH
jgi:ribonuclease HI